MSIERNLAVLPCARPENVGVFDRVIDMLGGGDSKDRKKLLGIAAGICSRCPIYPECQDSVPKLLERKGKTSVDVLVQQLAIDGEISSPENVKVGGTFTGVTYFTGISDGRKPRTDDGITQPQIIAAIRAYQERRKADPTLPPIQPDQEFNPLVFS